MCERNAIPCLHFRWCSLSIMHKTLDSLSSHLTQLNLPNWSKVNQQLDRIFVLIKHGPWTCVALHMPNKTNIARDQTSDTHSLRSIEQFSQKWNSLTETSPKWNKKPPGSNFCSIVVLTILSKSVNPFVHNVVAKKLPPITPPSHLTPTPPTTPNPHPHPHPTK